MSFLAKLSQLKKSTTSSTDTGSGSKATKKEDNPSLDFKSPILPEYYVRKEDPAIRRLKEKRRQEQLRKGTLKKASSQRRSKANGGEVASGGVRQEGSTRWKLPRPKSTVVAAAAPAPPLKKLSFEELMKQAEEKAKSPAASGKRTAPAGPSAPAVSKPGFKPRSNSGAAVVGGKVAGADKGARNGGADRTAHAPNSARGMKAKQAIAIDLPSGGGLAKPNEKLRRILEKQERRKRSAGEYEEDDSDLDDFIADDDGEEEGGSYGYDKEEIWSIFNKGRRRLYQEDDDNDFDDDMEANEMEILEEEDYSSKMARREDKMEEEWIRKYEREKKKRKRGA
ncbi:AGR161Cp [Eremothecium gossypii ATCC 10895]|uniref:AGR161Cp n=1 Tax=Eremothecium gossypii (strain ATCC 10895 / CBS 109.51 / FGSC 9923 / NRRL Y-1056) TaxID=284811 RepID=Q74ZN7_EREGS|nr:AGR161Cp [Eremothecium gossypii ATCC 10895]AAS54651.1 AGR161Cp [Eremothecium gossypii ATCC 10895]AEY98981.1 FAGR161Cp [Eremothecium gossypii FDAG1]